ncbi:MAG: glucose-6-phosphate dehydrogenase assembly protein OpcA [Verrucomicrobiae bacterium]|nr:glucose-6-phosphate dehydrogenase assembly protein OpcA [Verrucomicrobiae bacterium]
MTASPTNLDAFIAGLPAEVNVADIERQLSSMWQLAAETPGTPVARASMGTLIVLCATETELETATGIARDLTAHHPCRILAVLHDHTQAAPALSATITAHCHLGIGGGKQVCSEQITVRATGSAVAQIPSVVESLLEADLPVTTWWTSPWPDTGTLRDRLLALSDRVCFDTSNWPPQARHPPAIRAVLRAYPRTAFHDLSWIRLAFWRALTAELFDSDAAAAELPALHTIEIQHGTAPGAAWRAQLYAAWLQHRLGRRLRTRLTQQDLPETGLLDICILSAQGRFQIHKLPNEQAVASVAHLPTLCELPRKRALAPSDPLSLLCAALDNPRPPADYRAVLEILAQP